MTHEHALGTTGQSRPLSCRGYRMTARAGDAPDYRGINEGNGRRPAAASDRFPAPAVVVRADDGLPVAGDPVGTMVALAAELAGLVAIAAVGQRVAGHRRGMGWRRARR